MALLFPNQGHVVGAESLRGKSALFRRNGRSGGDGTNGGTNTVGSTCVLLTLSSATAKVETIIIPLSQKWNLRHPEAKYLAHGYTVRKRQD